MVNIRIIKLDGIWKWLHVWKRKRIFRHKSKRGASRECLCWTKMLPFFSWDESLLNLWSLIIILCLLRKQLIVQKISLKYHLFQNRRTMIYSKQIHFLVIKIILKNGNHQLNITSVLIWICFMSIAETYVFEEIVFLLEMVSFNFKYTDFWRTFLLKSFSRYIWIHQIV